MSEKGRGRDSGHPRDTGRILLAEDDRQMRELIALTLRRSGYAVEECANGLDLLEILDKSFARKEEIDLVLSDMRMPGITGLEILEYLQSREGGPSLLLITAFGDPATHDLVSRAGGSLLDKPFDFDQLLATVQRLIPFSAHRGGSSPTGENA